MIQGIRNLNRNGQGIGFGIWPFLDKMLMHCVTFYVLHYEIVGIAMSADVQSSNDIGVIEFC